MCIKVLLHCSQTQKIIFTFVLRKIKIRNRTTAKISQNRTFLIFVNVLQTDSPSWNPAMGVWTLCAGSLVAVFILYLVTLLPECSVTSEGEGLYQFAKL